MRNVSSPARLSMAASLVLCAGSALARQDAPPAPEAPAPAPQAPVEYGPDGRKVLNGEPKPLAFKNVTVEQMISFIVEATGKVVMPQQDVLTRRITVWNDKPIPRSEAVDLVFIALQQNGIAVIETREIIRLRDVAEVKKGDVPVIGPDESVLGRTDLGVMAEKVYRLKSNTAEAFGEVVKNAAPDYATLSIDEESNQIAVMGNIALLQRLEKLITALDSPSSGALATETFRLRYSDAEKIKTNIEELFGGEARSTGQNRNQQNQGRVQFFPGQQPQQQAASTESLRVTANTQQNSVTVVAEPAILEQIREQIEKYWDLELDPELVVPKIYDLENSDPVKVKTLLEGLFGRPTGVTQTGGGGGQQGGQASSAATSGAGRLAGQFSFQALPEQGRLVVVAKSPDHIQVIDEIIANLDKPQSVGLPAIIELKHASAEDLAEQLNTLLSQDGTLAQIRRAASGLSESTSTTSPFAQDQTATQDGQAADQTTSPDMIAFWWQRSRPPTDKQNASNLVGQIRIVPVWRQNALMVLSPPEYRAAMVQLISDLDRPGRQVLISAIVVELRNEDVTALGLRWSSSAIAPTNPDNAISAGLNATGTENNFLGSLFDTSVLNANVDLNVLLQLLAQKTKVNILSEPKVFTSDNQEAEFFTGQDIPFITETQPDSQGDLIQSFDYKAVGIQLRVRPRITVKRDVDLRVNLELSSIVPGQTLFGGAIIDRRETTTQLIVQNGQTIVMSGILRNEDTDIVRKVPILGDVPIVKWLFRSKERTQVQSELLLFITPVVIDNTGALDELNAPYRERLNERREQLGVEPVDPPAPAATTDPSGPGSGAGGG